MLGYSCRMSLMNKHASGINLLLKVCVLKSHLKFDYIDVIKKKQIFSPPPERIEILFNSGF